MNFVVTHVERIVRSNHDLADTGGVDQLPQNLRLVHQSVEPDAFEILARRVLQTLRFRAHAMAMIATSDVIGQITAAMGSQEPETGMAIERATEDQR